MSYSFSVKAADKAAVKDAVAAKFDEMVVTQQPVHARDRAAVLANANVIIDLLADDDTKDVSVSCNGYVSWKGTGDAAPGQVDMAKVQFVTVSVGCAANHVDRSGNADSADRA